MTDTEHIDRVFALALDKAYREDYMMRNPPPQPVSSVAVLLKGDKDGNSYTAYGDVSGGMIGYRNSLGGFGPNPALPHKQRIEGWLSPDGYVFGCDYMGHWGLSSKIVNALPPEEDAVSGNCERVLESRGWIKLRGGRDQSIGIDPTEEQAAVLLALMGA